MLLEGEKIDPRVKRTRTLLKTALRELAAEKPFDSITVQDIAARAEVNRATFYAHFEDKYALLNYSVREDFQARLDEKLPPEPALTPECLRSLIVTTCEFMKQFIGHCMPPRHTGDQVLMFLQVRSLLYETLLAWIRSTDKATDVIATTTGWAIWGSVFEWARDGYKIPAAQFTEQVLALLLTGLPESLPGKVLA